MVFAYLVFVLFRLTTARSWESGQGYAKLIKRERPARSTAVELLLSRYAHDGDNFIVDGCNYACKHQKVFAYSIREDGFSAVFHTCCYCKYLTCCLHTFYGLPFCSVLCGPNLLKCAFCLNISFRSADQFRGQLRVQTNNSSRIIFSSGTSYLETSFVKWIEQLE